MATSPRSPRMLRGALVKVDMITFRPTLTLFQYNPDTLKRTLQAWNAAEDGAPTEALRLGGAPTEMIEIEVELDAADQLEAGDRGAALLGIYPQLAALETLVYPDSAVVISNTALALAGSKEIITPIAPLTLFIWGPQRVLPVRIASVSVTEQAHDNNLSPLRAAVSLTLQVLTYDDLPLSHPGYAMFLAHHVNKEILASMALSGNLAASLGTGSIF